MSQKAKKQIQQTRKAQPVRISEGIACLRVRSDGVQEILLIRQRNTYAFSTFVRGDYDAANSDNMIKLFNGMTVEEKIIIVSRDFRAIWYHLFLGISPRWANMVTCQNKFINSFCSPGSDTLEKLIEGSVNSHPVWSIPKGRRDARETQLDCAVREFSEETGINKSLYQLIPCVQHSSSHISAGKKYIIHSFLAIAKGTVGALQPGQQPIHYPSVCPTNHSQCHEISDISWMSLDQIKHTPGAERILPHAQAVMSKYKKYTKQTAKPYSRNNTMKKYNTVRAL